MHSNEPRRRRMPNSFQSLLRVNHVALMLTRFDARTLSHRSGNKEQPHALDTI
jgi:hypothetical protein